MGIDQLVDAYKGNPQPLQAKVQQAQKNQPPGAIPPDLEEAIALQKITELRNSAQNQQAMQAGGAQPSVVEKMRQMLGAEQRQQAQPPQMPQGMPEGQPQMAQAPQQPPQGQPVMAARGGSIDQLMSNLGRHYDEGGIITPKNLSFTPSNSSEGRDYERELLKRDEEALAGELRAKFLNEVGKKDVSVYDEMAAELKAQRERAKGPEKGYGALMEYLGQIAQSGGGRDWTESGAKGAAGLNALQKARQERQDALAEKILDLGAKKQEAVYNEKLGLFNLTKAEKDRIIKDKTEVAGRLGLSEDKERELIQTALLEEAKMKNQMAVARAGSRDNLAERAAKIRAENSGMSYEESIRRAALAGGATSVEGTNAKTSKAYIDAKNKIDERFQHLISDTPYGKKQKQLYDNAIAELNQTFGVSGGGINALPAAAAPIPAGAKPSDLNVGTIYQTARGPARWNGKTFDPVQ